MLILFSPLSPLPPSLALNIAPPSLTSFALAAPDGLMPAFSLVGALRYRRRPRLSEIAGRRSSGRLAGRLLRAPMRFRSVCCQPRRRGRPADAQRAAPSLQIISYIAHAAFWPAEHHGRRTDAVGPSLRSAPITSSAIARRLVAASAAAAMPADDGEGGRRESACSISVARGSAIITGAGHYSDGFRFDDAAFLIAGQVARDFSRLSAQEPRRRPRCRAVA